MRRPVLAAVALFAAAFVAALSAIASAAAEPDPPPAPELVIDAPERLGWAVTRIEALDQERLWTAVELAGLDDPGPPIRIVLAAEDSPQARAVHSWVAGYARGATGAIVIFPERTPSYPDDSLEELVHHEVAHILISRAAAGRPLPRWFHEGVAMAAGRAWGIEDTSRFVFQVLRSGPVELARTEGLFSGGGAAAARAYAVSGAFVRDLTRRHGEEVTGEILRRVGRGVAFDEAFRQATGESLAAAEESFWRRRTFWQRWLPFLTSSFAIWMVVTLLALLAFYRRRRRDAALEERWEQEEAVLRPPPPSPEPLRGERGGGNGPSGSSSGGSPWIN